ncbi:Tab2/Atab2 family RNA-binding protein [Crocosphaera sp. XPORK-15E]|uniref:Tab2/Atab2 family RNA-binding protein n=1 Tax=Crocosphaera sp. XPORK-15E TaxID=3110247 RepID=UPI002B21A5C8|nr:Tab2/Atab2 family RNA-binding protein [Crocosphaera sp. XPORK-15E]MEA5532632.1 Tab2/Atab2 family RNA-binding protein [Crocosphaera sp. XPORK-15E]
MNIWQADFYKHSFNNLENSYQWELIICDSQGKIIHEAICQQSQANSTWLINQLKPIIEQYYPDVIQVFRPQSLSLLTLAGEALNIKVEPSRRTFQLKEILKQRHPNSIKLEQLPPQPLPENLWGDKWHFASFKAGDIIDFFCDRPIPIKDFPDSLKPINLGIHSQTNIPGVIIYGGRKSMYLARWLAENKPVALTYIPTEVGKSGGLILDAGLIERWVLLTFEDLEMAKAAQQYEEQKEASQGLHFLLIQPDDSGMTYTGVWLLKREDS